MKKIVLSLATFFLLTSVQAQTTSTDTLTNGGVVRNYITYLPPGFSNANNAPLILNFHGLGSNATEQMAYSNFMPIADTAGFVMVCPNGTTLAGTAYWNVGFGGNADDVGFVDKLITKLIAQYNINPNRIYATGMSNGGYMSYFLAKNLNNRIAAIASVTGTMVPSEFSSLSPNRAVPVMQIHGDADPTVPYQGNATGVHIDSLVKKWRTINNVNATATVTPLPDVNTSDNSTATHYVWSGGTNGSSVEFYKIAGGEHTWPGSPFVLGVTNQDFSASEEIWRFFRGYTLSQFTAIGEVESPVTAAHFWPNPCTNELRLDKSANGSLAFVYNVAGQKVLSNTISDAILSVAELPVGRYFLVLQNAKGSVSSGSFMKK